MVRAKKATEVTNDPLDATLARLQLSGIRDQLDTLLDEAARANLSARLRDELLNDTLFRSLACNNCRPHSQLGWMSPAIYAASATIRYAPLHRRLRSADRRPNHPGGRHYSGPESNSDWIIKAGKSPVLVTRSQPNPARVSNFINVRFEWGKMV